MHIFMPMLKERFIQLLPDHSSDSVLIQKQIFKILYALFQVGLLPPCFSAQGFHHIPSYQIIDTGRSNILSVVSTV